jgi:rhodanese-related sulfurtransferase
MTASKATVHFVDPATAIAWAAAGEVVIVDVREPHERRQARIPGSVANPLSAFDPTRVPDEPGKRLLFHCHGGMRCGPASDRMVQAGRTGDIYRLRGGIVAWAQAGGPLESGPEG